MNRNVIAAAAALALAFALALAGPVSVVAQASGGQPQLPARAATVAFLGVRNLDVDPRLDYVGGIVQGLLLFDLTNSPGVTLVERTRLDKVLEEQELLLSGLLADQGAAVRVGGLLGADFLVYAEYVAFSGEALVTVRVVNVASGRAGAFTERGGDENVVHRAAESLVQYLSGVRPAFASTGGARGIVSLRDESPGSVALHSHLIRAEIFLDGEFVGYTTGAVDQPFVIERVAPGPHSIRVRLGRGFGVVKQPEISFGDWEQGFELRPGERKVLRDQTRDFNSILYAIQNLLREDFYYRADTAEKAAARRELSFQDRRGRTVMVSLEPRPTGTEAAPAFAPLLTVGGEEAEYALVGRPGEEVELDVTLGLVRFEMTVDLRYGQARVGLSLERTDVYQGMYDE